MDTMRMESVKEFAQLLSDQSAVSYFYLEKDFWENGGFYDPMCPDFAVQLLYSSQLNAHLQQIPEAKLHHIIASFGVHFLVLRLLDGEGFFGMGPLRYKRPSKQELDQYLQQYHLPRGCLSPLNYYLDSITHEHANSKPLEYVMAHIYHCISKNYDRSASIPRIHLEPVFSPEDVPDLPSEPNVRQFHILHSRDSVLRELVAQGKRREAGIVLESYAQPRYFYQSNFNALHDLISLNIIYKQALLESGANPGQTEQLYHKFLQKTAEDIGRLDKTASTWSARMLDDYCRLARERKTRDYSRLVSKAIDYILLNHCGTLTVPILADHLHLTPSYLSSVFKKETGISLTAYISKVRVESSMTLLQNTNRPISEIAEAVGFNDYNYFTRVFGRVYGMTPTQYRKDKSSHRKHT